MAEDNIKDFTINWIIVGILSFCLISFTISFMFYNNPSGLGGDVSSKLTGLSSEFNTELLLVDSKGESVSNITAQTNPEAGLLGSRDSVAAAFETKQSSIGFFKSLKILIAWIVVGDLGKMLVSVFSGFFGFISVYFIVKWIRTGT